MARTAWLYTTEDFIGDVAAHPEGGLAFMRQTPGGSAPARLDAEGRLLWARQGVSAREGLLGLSVSPAGELYAWGWVDGGNTTGSNRAVRYTRDGKSRVVVGGCGDECGIDAFLEDAQGGMLRSWTSLGNTHVHYVRADGSGWRLDDLLEDAPSASPFELYDQALLDSGDAFVSAGLLGRVTYWDRDFGVPGEERDAILKIAPDGSLHWAYETPAIDGPGYGLGVVAIPDGSVFGFGVYRGALEWEGLQLPTAEPDAERLFLFALSPAGKLQWVRALPASRFAIGTRGQLGVLTVLPQLAEGSCAALQVAVYARSGELEWARTLTNVGCRGQLSVDSVTFVGKDLVLAGYFSGEVDLGTGPLRAPEERPRGFLLGLRSP